jgi:hypothetical protein
MFLAYFPILKKIEWACEITFLSVCACLGVYPPYGC